MMILCSWKCLKPFPRSTGEHPESEHHPNGILWTWSRSCRIRSRNSLKCGWCTGDSKWHQFIVVQPLVTLNGQVPLAWWSLSNLLKLDDIAHVYSKWLLNTFPLKCRSCNKLSALGKELVLMRINTPEYCQQTSHHTLAANHFSWG